MDAKKIRDDFPILCRQNPQAYFDNACTTFKPNKVIEAVDWYNRENPACAGRSLHRLSAAVDEKFARAREEVARHINSKPEEVVWTRNSSEAMNLVALAFDFTGKNKVVTTNLEHHSALLPFMSLAKKGRIGLEFAIAEKSDCSVDAGLEKKIDEKTALVVVHHTNNTLGTSADIGRIAKVAHEKGALVLVDGAQGVAHHKVDFRGLGIDFLAFSGHKMLGPTGIGCLVGKYPLLEKLGTFMLGGETVETVGLEGFVLKKPPKKFEAGIQDYAGAIGLGAACSYLGNIGMRGIEEHEKKLCRYLFDKMKAMDRIRIFGPQEFAGRSGTIIFGVNGVKSAHEVALMLSEMSDVCVRSGMFCAQPAVEFLGAPHGAVRLSAYLYNTIEDADRFLDALQKVAGILGK
ncbi:cysteine desulfurase [Candidatus Parvarchaeota archaeon]|nr:cysteine desulfurase [Candidatus Parvarchaeota archaeon]